MKSWFVHVLDRIDDKVFAHRFYWMCTLVSITLDKWWPEYCGCNWCEYCRVRWDDVMDEVDNDVQS